MSEDPAADLIIDKVLGSLRQSRERMNATQETATTEEKTRVADAIGATSIEEPFVVKLVGEHGKVPDSVLDDIVSSRLRWGI